MDLVSPVKVTYVAGYELTPKSPDIQMVYVPDVKIFEKMPNLFTTDPHEAMFAIYNDMQVACSIALGYEGVQRLKDEEYDLVIAQAGLSECFLSFAYKLQVCRIFESMLRGTLCSRRQGNTFEKTVA